MQNPKVFRKYAVIHDGCIKIKHKGANIMTFPDFSKIKFDMSSMNTFFKAQGVNVAAGDSAKLNTIFQECDTEGAKNADGENIGDGVLNGEERTTFLNKIKTSCPQLYDKIVDFFTIVEITEDKEEENIAFKKAEAEIHERMERELLIDDFQLDWHKRIDDKILTAQLKELENIDDKATLEKKLMEFQAQNRKHYMEKNIKFGLDN